MIAANKQNRKKGMKCHTAAREGAVGFTKEAKARKKQGKVAHRGSSVKGTSQPSGFRSAGATASMHSCANKVARQKKNSPSHRFACRFTRGILAITRNPNRDHAHVDQAYQINDGKAEERHEGKER